LHRGHRQNPSSRRPSSPLLDPPLLVEDEGAPLFLTHSSPGVEFLLTSFFSRFIPPPDPPHDDATRALVFQPPTPPTNPKYTPQTHQTNPPTPPPTKQPPPPHIYLLLLLFLERFTRLREVGVCLFLLTKIGAAYLQPLSPAQFGRACFPFHLSAEYLILLPPPPPRRGRTSCFNQDIEERLPAMPHSPHFSNGLRGCPCSAPRSAKTRFLVQVHSAFPQNPPTFLLKTLRINRAGYFLFLSKILPYTLHISLPWFLIWTNLDRLPSSPDRRLPGLFSGLPPMPVRRSVSLSYVYQDVLHLNF